MGVGGLVRMLVVYVYSFIREIMDWVEGFADLVGVAYLFWVIFEQGEKGWERGFWGYA